VTLLPELKPYEAALYFYMLCHSIVEHGEQYVRVLKRRLQCGVVKFPYADTGKGGEAGVATYRTIQPTLGRLEAAGAIRMESRQLK
jgi:hypothetical protein